MEKQETKFKASVLSYINRDNNTIKLLFVLFALFVIMCILQPKLFLTVDNFVSMANQFPEFGLMALGVMLAIVAGGINLSLVGIANLSAISVAALLIKTCPAGVSDGKITLMIILCALIGVIVGALCGAFNGVLIGKLNIPPMLATLGSQKLFAGIAMIFTRGSTISGFPFAYTEAGTYAFFGVIPVPLIIFVLAVIVVGYMMSGSTFGTRLYLLGTNAKASRFAGQDNLGVIVTAHTTGGILAAFAGLIMMARMNSARSDFGSSYTMQAVLVAVLGGVNPSGGFGTVSGVVIAVLILQFFSSGLNMFPDLSAYIKTFAWGVTLIVVMIINYYSNKKRGRI